jgi:hypothetical protein
LVSAIQLKANRNENKECNSLGISLQYKKMRATLSFNLNDYDDIQAHIRCIKATELALALWELKAVINCAIDESEDGKYVNGDYLVERMNDIFEKFGINFNELIS